MGPPGNLAFPETFEGLKFSANETILNSMERTKLRDAEACRSKRGVQSTMEG